MNEPHTHTQVSCLIHQRAKNDLGQKKVVVVIKKFFSRFSGNFFFFFWTPENTIKTCTHAIYCACMFCALLCVYNKRNINRNI